jgi:hypothetical protein
MLIQSVISCRVWFVENAADVSELYVASIFRVEVVRLDVFLCDHICLCLEERYRGRVGVAASTGPIGTADRLPTEEKLKSVILSWM